MIPFDYKDTTLQGILRHELLLGASAFFGPRDVLNGTELFEYSFGTITDGDLTYILLTGTFVATDVYVIIKTDLPEEFHFPMIAQEIKTKGLDPEKTRLVCVAVNTPGKVPGAYRNPEIQIMRVPF